MDTCLMFLFMLSALTVIGVFGDEVKSVSVMEGDSVTLHTDVTKQKEDKIMWTHGPENTFIARLTEEVSSNVLSDDERFRDPVKINNQTGDLTITNITTQHNGEYTLKIIRHNKVSYKKFNVTVHAPPPIPKITRDSSSSVSKCSVLCSVENVSHVSLSWYKGSSLLSSISVSDLNIRLSLPLEVDCEDTNTHTCVLNNTIMNHTQQLHITQLCQCPGSPKEQANVIPAVVVSVISIIIISFIIGISISFFIYRRAKANKRKSSEGENLTKSDKKRSIDSSNSSEDQDASRFLNEKQHWIGAGSV